MGFCNLWSTLGELCVCRVCNPVIVCLLRVRMSCHLWLDSNPRVRKLVCACITCGGHPHRSFSVQCGKLLKPHPIFLTSCWTGTVEETNDQDSEGWASAEGRLKRVVMRRSWGCFTRIGHSQEISLMWGEKEHTSFAWMDGWRHISDISAYVVPPSFGLLLIPLLMKRPDLDLNQNFILYQTTRILQYSKNVPPSHHRRLTYVPPETTVNYLNFFFHLNFRDPLRSVNR